MTHLREVETLGTTNPEIARLQNQARREVALRRLENDDRASERQDRRHRRAYELAALCGVLVAGLFVLLHLRGDRTAALGLLAGAVLYGSGYLTGRAFARLSP